MFIAITGPTGSGKSSVAYEITQNLDRAVLIDVDTVKHFIMRGFIYDKTSEGLEQWLLLGDNLNFLVKTYLEKGYIVLLEGFLPIDAWKRVFDNLQPNHKFLLLPENNVVIDRDISRGKEKVMGSDSVLKHHDMFTTEQFFNDFTNIDSSNGTVKETASILLSYLK